MKKKILIVEDEDHIADGLQINLEGEGYDTMVAPDGRAALQYWKEGEFDLIILDIMLPGMDGLEICRVIRKSGDRIPILFLSARDRDDDKVEGLLAGGDDYITKPFNLKELILRVAAIFRRQVWYASGSTEDSRYQFGEFWVDFSTYKAKGVEGEVELSQKECMIMKYLVEHADEVVTRDMLLNAVWGYNVYPSSRTVDNFIVRLRKIFEADQSHAQYIHTIRGAGYKFTPMGES